MRNRSSRVLASRISKASMVNCLVEVREKISVIPSSSVSVPPINVKHTPRRAIDLQTWGQPGFCISAGFVKLLLSKPQDEGEVSPLEGGVPEDGHLEVGVDEVGPLEVGLDEGSPLEVGVGEVGPLEGGPEE